jgi:hypothetical protein
VVEDWMYTQLTDQYVLDPQVQLFGVCPTFYT